MLRAYCHVQDDQAVRTLLSTDQKYNIDRRWLNSRKRETEEERYLKFPFLVMYQFSEWKVLLLSPKLVSLHVISKKFNPTKVSLPEITQLRSGSFKIESKQCQDPNLYCFCRSHWRFIFTNFRKVSDRISQFFSIITEATAVSKLFS